MGTAATLGQGGTCVGAEAVESCFGLFFAAFSHIRIFFGYGYQIILLQFSLFARGTDSAITKPNAVNVRIVTCLLIKILDLSQLMGISQIVH